VTASLNTRGSGDIGVSNVSADAHADNRPHGVPCVYCRTVIPAATFTFWSDAKRLLSADCPACERRVTLAASTWRRWLRSVSA